MTVKAGILSSGIADEGYGDLGRPMLGVVMTPPSSGDLRNNELESPQGVVIRRVYGGSSAEEMGLQYGDLITEINGVEVNSMSTLRQIIQNYQPGDKVRVEGLRGGEPIASDGFLRGWPDNIPFRDIDANSESRYRDRVANRMARQEQSIARREETLDRLRQQEQTLKDEIEEIKNAQNEAAQQNPLQQQAMRALQAFDDLLSGDVQGLENLRQLPSTRLLYGFQVGKCAETNSSPTVTKGQPNLSFSFVVADDML